MPNYEELYNIARSNYNQAIDNRNSIRRKISELQGRKATLVRELEEKQVALTAIQQKKMLIQNALKKCEAILSNEFLTMKADIQRASDEYKKIIISDMGVADLSLIYASDISQTQNNLNSINAELGSVFKSLEEEEVLAQKSVADCNSELSSVINQLNSVGSEAAAQRQADNYYAEMKVYETKWQNGE